MSVFWLGLIGSIQTKEGHTDLHQAVEGTQTAEIC